MTLAQHLRRFFRTMMCYGITGLILSPLMKIWLHGIEIPYWIASFLSLLVVVPLNFLMNKHWSFAKND